ncbi:hypothetical protein AQUCO_07400001v1 [Aquilegia coerulea]|uniref:Uncharacterized protein n=1 Tax=Aquilegia coerulea TaxID=218851 RepID=A0A2G5C9A8_AQUCA|nr:hypothetical protein AQUCO_07400001v1 [Aquilegia coerulea]
MWYRKTPSLTFTLIASYSWKQDPKKVLETKPEFSAQSGFEDIKLPPIVLLTGGGGLSLSLLHGVHVDT